MFNDRSYIVSLNFKDLLKIQKLEQNNQMHLLDDVLNCGFEFNNNIEIAIKEFAILQDRLFKPKFCGESENNQEITFNYIADFDLIYALFFKAHKIDLFNEDIDLVRFYYLLSEIMSDQNALNSRISLRTKKTSDIKDMSQKKALQKAKKTIEIKKGDTLL